MGRSVVFSAFYADFCFCSKLVIITTLKDLDFGLRLISQNQTQHEYRAMCSTFSSTFENIHIDHRAMRLAFSSALTPYTL